MINGKKFFNEFYIHELAHQWFGDAVSPAGWKDIWLNEGFASYSEALFAENQSGPSAYHSTMRSKFRDSYRGTVFNPDNMFSSTVYDKGAWVLHMLRREVGDSVFFRILRTYYDKYKYGNASTDDFEKICEYVSSRNLNYFFKQWIYEGEDQLTLKYKWQLETNNNKYNIHLQIDQEQEDFPLYRFPLDLSIKLENKNESIKKTIYIDKRESTIDIPVETKPISVTLDPDNWLLATIQNPK